MDWLWQIFDRATIGIVFSQFRNEMAAPTFWIALGKIIWINILLSGDNALVIAWRAAVSRRCIGSGA